MHVLARLLIAALILSSRPAHAEYTNVPPGAGGGGIGLFSGIVKNDGAGNPSQAVAGTDYQAPSANLTALLALSSTGFAVRTGTNTWAQRTIAGTANQITFTNGDGIAGNPTASFPTQVAIGTATPSSIATLTVNAPTSATNPIGVSATNTTAYAQIGFLGSARIWSAGVGNASESTLGVSNKFFIHDAGSGSATPRMVIDTSGNVGVGTSSPSAQLHTTGTVRFAGLPSVATPGCLSNDSSGNIIGGNACSSGGLPAGGTAGQMVYKIDGTAGNASWGAPPCINIKGAPYNAVGSGAVNDATAIQLALTAINSAGHGCIFLPQGTYRLDSQLQALTASTTFIGAGGGVTQMLVNNSTGGLSLAFDNTSTGNNGTNALHVRDMDFICVTGGSCGTAVSVVGTGLPAQPQQQTGSVSGVNIRSSGAAGTEKWANGIYVKNLSSFTIERSGWYQGGNTTGIFVNLDYSANAGGTPGYIVKMDKLSGLGGTTQVKSRGGHEAIYISNSDLICGDICVDIDGTLGFLGRSDVVNISGGNITGGAQAIKVVNMVSVIINGGDYTKRDETDVDTILVQGTGVDGSGNPLCQSVVISNLKVDLLGTANGSGAIHVDDCAYGAITGNSIYMTGGNGYAIKITGSNKLGVTGNQMEALSPSGGSAYFIDSTAFINVNGNIDTSWSTQMTGGSNASFTMPAASNPHF